MYRFLINLLIFTCVAFVLIFVVELSCRLLKVPKISHHNIYSKSQDLIPIINNNTILILGDSRLEWGIKPLKVLEKLTKDSLNVINMALPGSNGLDILIYLKKNNIYPRLILMGYTPNYGRNKNHGLDLISYSKPNAIKEKIKYSLKQTLYLQDQSIKEYIINGFPYFKNHKYDALGGAIVNEYGDYAKRLEEQIVIYNTYKNSFDSLGLKKYCTEMNTMIKIFRKNGSVICGIYMPVSKRIFDIEASAVYSKPQKINFDRFYDFSNYTYTVERNRPDSTYFYDGSHLSHKYSDVFSEKLVRYISKSHPDIK